MRNWKQDNDNNTDVRQQRGAIKIVSPPPKSLNSNAEVLKLAVSPFDRCSRAQHKVEIVSTAKGGKHRLRVQSSRMFPDETRENVSNAVDLSAATKF